DLLLGTQGWRRFAEQDPTKFRKELEKQGDADEAERLLVGIGQSAPLIHAFASKPIEQVDAEATRKIDADLAPEIDRLNERSAAAGKEVEIARSDAGYQAALAKLASYREKWDRVRAVLFPALAVVLALGVLVCFFVALAREPRRALPFYAGMAA